jgi:hypothetical protein
VNRLSTPSTTSAKNGLPTELTIRPNVPVRLLLNEAAARLYTYPRSVAVRRTRSRVLSATCGLSRMTRETVAFETPLASAMCSRVIRPFGMQLPSTTI